MIEGPEIKEKMVVKCGDCNKSLLNIVITKGNNELTKLKVYCPCGGSSFLIPIQGSHRICPVDNLFLKNVLNLDNKEEVYLGKN